MNVKINNQNYKIKFASQLTTGEYIKYMDSLNEKSGNFDQLINYIATVTGLKNSDAAAIDIDDNSIRRLTSYIGVVYAPTEFQQLDRFYYKRKGRIIYKNSLNWRTLGARKLLEERKTESHLEQATYLLACYISDDYDSEKIELIYDELLDYDANLVFGFIIFFFKKLTNGVNQGKTSWLKRKLTVVINILRSSKK